MTENVSGNDSDNDSNNGCVSFKDDISSEDPGTAQNYKDRCLHEVKDDVLLKALVCFFACNQLPTEFYAIGETTC